jgi:hypothetical protein
VGSLRVLSWHGGGMRYALVGQAQTRNLMLAADLLSRGTSAETAPQAKP